MPGGRASLPLVAALSLLLALRTVVPLLAGPDEREGGALWVVRTTLASRASMDRAIDAAVEGGFRTLFVQAVGRGDALFPSSILPGSPLLTASSEPDPFGYFLDRAHRRGLEVHVWINVLYAWSAPREPDSPRHVVRRHPEWLTVRLPGGGVDGDGDSARAGREGTDRFLSPALPAVRDHLEAVVREILGRYAVDGVHLDYIRYPSEDSGFEEPSRARFRGIYKVDPVEVCRGGGPEGDGLDAGTRERYRALWTLWRARQVTELLRGIRRVQESMAPGVRLSAAVVPDIARARDRYGQDWVRWVKDGLVDRVVLMAYSPRPGQVMADAREALRQVGREHLTVGIAVYNQPLERALQTVRDLRAMGVARFSFFSYNTMLELPGAFARIRRELFDGTP
jgi:uncharacterized lipoprotein YddW (UPF0748 family)